MSPTAIAGHAALFFLLSLSPVAGGAGVSPPEPAAVGLQAFTLEHQSAAGAVELVLPLLSETGAVELQPGSNTLVVRDRPERLERVLEVLRDFDHPSSPLRFKIQIVRAGGEPDSDEHDAHEHDSEEPSETLSPELVGRLTELLRYDSYRLLAGTRLAVREGEQISYRFGDEFGVGFRLGTLLEDGRVKLHGFRILRDVSGDGATDGFGERQLIHTNLNLWLGKPMILGLARAESSDKALMVVLTCELEEAGD